MYLPTDDENRVEEEFVKIYSSTDDRMKELGQILKTPKSRMIYRILMDKELHTKEIGVLLENEDNPRLPNLTHHLKKMTRIGLLNSRLKIKNGHTLTYYRAVKYIILVPDDDIEIASKSKTLKSTLKKVFKISTIAGTTLSSYFVVKAQSVSVGGEYSNLTGDTLLFTIPIAVLTSSIIVERIIAHYYESPLMKIKRSLNTN